MEYSDPMPHSLILDKTVRLLGALALLLTLAVCRAGQPLPPLQVESLAGADLALPGDLAPCPCVFVIGFSKASRDLTAQWSRLLHAELESASAASYGVAVLEDVPRWLRGMVIRGIRSGVPERTHDRFLLALSAAATWKRITEYSDGSTAYLLLLDSAHRIVWRFAGAPSEAALESIKTRIRAR